MGTNYYLNTICPTCGHHMRRYHIGKNSWGWIFHFQEIHTPYVNVTNLQGMKEITEMGMITDEYGREIPYDEFWKIVEKTKEPMPDGSPKHTTHDGLGRERLPYFCWEKDGYAWSSMDFCLGEEMVEDKINKNYYNNSKEFKLFGIKVLEVNYTGVEYDGKGSFINESTPDREYFEREFRKEK